MSELPLNVGTMASLPAAVQVTKSKDDIEKYASVIREVSNFANSDVGKMLIERIMPKSPGNPVGNPQPSKGEFKPMPSQNGVEGVGFSPNFAPSGQRPPVAERIVVREVPVPLTLSAADQYSMFMNGLTELVKQVGGEEKTLKEAIEWAQAKKEIIIMMTPPLKINPPTP